MEQYRNSEKETKYGDHSSNNPQIIPLTNLLKKGIVYEEVQDFEHSIYNNVYLWAKEAVEQITADSRHILIPCVVMMKTATIRKLRSEPQGS